jgi:hypothetical protein
MAASFPEYIKLFSTLPETLLISGRILLHNTTPTVVAGKGFTVAKNGTAIYRITFNKNMGRVVAAFPSYTGTDARLVKKVAHVEGRNYVEFRFENTSAAATEPGATGELEFLVVCTRTKAAI